MTRRVDELRAAWERSPRDAGAFDELVDELVRGGDPDELVRLYDDAAATAPSVVDWERLGAALQTIAESASEANVRAAALYRLGRLRERRFKDPTGALAAFRKAVASWPLHLPALRACRRAHAEADDWATVAKLLDHELKIVRAAPARVQLLLERAALAARQLPDRHAYDVASAAIDELLREHPELEAHVEAARGSGALEPPPNTTAQNALSADRTVVAREYTDETIDEHARTMDQGVDTTAEIDVSGFDHDTVSTEAVDTRRRSEPLSDLSPIPESISSTDESAGAGDTAESETGSPTERLLREARRLQAGAEDREAAVDRLRQAAAGASREPSIQRDLLALADVLGQPDIARAAVEVLAFHPEIRADERTPLARRLIDDHVARAQEREADSVAVRLAARYPREPDMRALLVERVHAIDEAARRFEIVEKLVRQGPAPEELLGVVRKVALEAEEASLAPERVEKLWRQLRRFRPNDAAAHRFYARYYEARGEWARVLASLQGLRDVASEPGEALALTERMARIAEDRLADPERAIDAYRTLIRRSAASGDATERLAALLERHERWNALVELRREQLAAAEDEETIVPLLEEIAEIYDRRLGLGVMAVRTLQEIHRRRRGDEEIQRRLLDAYERLGRWSDLVELLEEAAAGAAPDRARDMLRRAAEVWEERLANPARAAAAREKLLAIDDGQGLDSDEQAGTIAWLRRHYRERGQTSNWLDVEERHLTTLSQAARGERALAIARRCLDELGDVDRAERFARLAAKSAETREAAQGLLAEAARRRGDDGQLVDALGDRVRAGTATLEDHLEFARALDELERPEEARAAWESLLERAPDHEEAVAQLTRRYQRLGDWERLTALARRRGGWEELFDMLRVSASRATSPAEREALLERMVSVASDQLDDRARLAQTFLLMSDLPGEPGRDALRRLAAMLESADSTSEELENVELKRIDVLRQLVERSTGDNALAARTELAKLLARDDRHTEAFTVVVESVEQKPQEGGLRAEAERLARDADRLREYYDRVRPLAAKMADGSARLTLHRDLARIAEELGRLDEAAGYYERIAIAEPDDVDALRALSRLYAQTGDAEREVDAMERLVELTRSEDERSALRRTIAERKLESLGDAESAARIFDTLLAEEPDDDRLLDSFYRAAVASERWEDAASALERLIDRSTDPAERAQRLADLAELSLEQLDDAARFERAAEELLAPVHAGSARDEIIAQLAGELGEQLPAETWASLRRPLETALRSEERWDELARIGGAALAREGEDVTTAKFEELVTLHDERRDDPDAALDVALSWLQRRPASDAPWERTERLAERTGRFRDVARAWTDLLASDLAAAPTKRLVQAARMIERAGETSDASVTLWAEVRRRERRNTDAIRALLDHTDSEEDVELRLELLFDLASTRAGDERLDALREAGSLLEQEVGALERAADVQRQILSESPDDSLAIAALERLVQREGDIEELVTLQLRRAALARGDERVRHLLRAVDMQVERRGDVPAAVEALSSAWEEETSERVADASMRVWELAREDPDRVLVRSELGERLSAWLDAAGDRDALQAVVEDRLETATEPSERKRLWERLVDLASEDAGGSDALPSVLVRAVAELPHVAHFRARLEGWAEEEEDWSAVREVYAKTIERGEASEEVELALARRLASLAELLGDLEDAERWHREVLARDPDAADTMRALERYYRQRGDAAALRALLEQRLDAEGDRERRRALFVELTRLAVERSPDGDSTGEILRRFASEFPRDQWVLQQIDDWLVARGDWQRLAAFLRGRLERESGERRAASAHRLARLLDERLDRPVDAAQIWRELLHENPGDREAFDALVALGDRRGNPRHVAELLEQRAKAATGHEALDAWIRLAELTSERLHDPGAALSALRSAARVAPDEPRIVALAEGLMRSPKLVPQVAELLAQLYRAGERWSDLARSLLLRADAERDPGRRLPWLDDALEIYRERLQDWDGAFAVAAAAYRASGGESQRRELLERLAGLSGNERALAELYADMAEAVGDRERLLLRLRAAALFAHKLGEWEKAERQYVAVLEEEPSQPAALAALEEVYERSGRVRELTRILAGWLPRSEGAELRARARRLVELQEVELGQPDAAVETLHTWAELEPSATEPWAELRRIHSSHEQWPDAIASAEQERARHSDEHVRARLDHLIGLWEIRYRRDPVQALDALERAVQDPATAAEAEPALGAIAFSVDSPGEIAARAASAILRHVAEIAPYRRADLLERVVEFTEGRRRHEALFALERIYRDDLGDAEALWDTMRRRLRATSPPSDWSAFLDVSIELGRVATAARALEDAAALLEEQGEPEASAALWELVAGAREEHLEDAVGARDALETVVRLQPSNLEAAGALESLYRGQADWLALADLYEAQLRAERDGERVIALRSSLASLYDGVLDVPDAAVVHYEALLEQDPDSDDVASALERLYGQLGRWQAQVELLRVRLRKEPDADQRARMGLRLARTAFRRCGDAETALAVLRELVPVTRFTADTRAMLEALFAWARASSPPEQVIEIAELLRTMYDPRTSPEAVDRLLEAQLEVSEDVERRRGLWSDRIELHTATGGNLQRAFDVARTAVLEFPSDSALRDAFRVVAGKAGRVSERAGVLTNALRSAEAPDVADAIRAELAECLERDLGRPEEALRLHRERQEAGADDLELLRAIGRLADELGRAELAVGAWRSLADRTEDADERVDSLRRVATFSEARLRQNADAIRAWERVHEERPDDEDTLAALHRLYRAEERWQELVEIVSARRERAATPRDRSRLAVGLADIFEQKLQDPTSAMRVLGEVLDDDPRHEDARDRLVALARSQEDWMTLAAQLAERAELAPTDAARAERLIALARLEIEELGDREAAVGHLIRVLDSARRLSSPRVEAAIDLLESLRREGGAGAERAAVILSLFYERTGRWPDLIALLELAAESATEARARSGFHARIADLYEHTLRRSEESLQHRVAAFESLPDDESRLDELVDLSRRLRRTDVVLLALDRVAESATDDDEYRRWMRRAARLAIDLGADPGSARQRLEQVLELAPDDLEAERLLELVYRRTQQWQPLVELLDARWRRERGDERARRTFERLIQLVSGTVRDRERQLSLLSEGATTFGDDPVVVEPLRELLAMPAFGSAAFDILEPIIRERGDPEALAELLVRRARTERSGPVSARLLSEAAQIHGEQLDDSSTAFRLSRDALAQDPTLDERFAMLGRWADSEEQLRAMADAWALRADAIPDRGRRADRLVSAARIRLRVAGDVEGAAELYRRVLNLVPDHEVAYNELEGIYEGIEDYAALAALLRERFERTDQPRAKGQLALQIAKLAVDRPDRVKGAVTWARRAVELLPDSDEAPRLLATLGDGAEDADAVLTALRAQLRNASGISARSELRWRIIELLRASGELEAATDELRLLHEENPRDTQAQRELVDILREDGAWEELETALRRQLSHAQDSPERIDLLFELADLVAGPLSRPTAAIERYREILALDPTNARAFQALEERLREASRWGELVALLAERAVTGVERPVDRGTLALQAASIAIDRLGELDRAKEILGRFAQTVSGQTDVVIRLAELEERSGNRADAIEQLRRALPDIADGGGRARVMQALADMHVRAGDRARAASVLERAWRTAGDEAPASLIESLERIYEEEGDWEALVGLAERAPIENASREMRERVARAARLAFEEFGDPDRAIALLERANLAAEDPEAAQLLLAAYSAAGREDEARPLLADLVEQRRAQGRVSDLPHLLHRLGVVARRQGDPDAAIAAFEECFERAPTYLANVLALGELHQEMENWSRALEVLRSAVVVQGELPDDAARLELFHRVGQLYEKTDDLRRARDMYLRALRIDPDHAPSRAALDALG